MGVIRGKKCKMQKKEINFIYIRPTPGGGPIEDREKGSVRMGIKKGNDGGTNGSHGGGEHGRWWGK